MEKKLIGEPTELLIWVLLEWSHPEFEVPCVESFFFNWPPLHNLLCYFFNDILLSLLCSFLCHVNKFLKVHPLLNVLIEFFITNCVLNALCKLVKLVVLDKLVRYQLRLLFEVFKQICWFFLILQMLAFIWLIGITILFLIAVGWQEFRRFLITSCTKCFKLWVLISSPFSHSFWDLRFAFMIKRILTGQ